MLSLLHRLGCVLMIERVECARVDRDPEISGEGGHWREGEGFEKPDHRDGERRALPADADVGVQPHRADLERQPLAEEGAALLLGGI